MIRLGFPVRILGRAGLRSYDTRQRMNRPHLSVSLLYLRDVLAYLVRHSINCYRLSDAFAPFLNDAQCAEYQRQIEECAPELAALGAEVLAARVRLSMHMGMHVALGTDDDTLARRAIAELVAQGALLDALGASDAVLVVHLGGAGDDVGALDRFARRYSQLPPATRPRVVVEQGDHNWGLDALLRLHQVCGVPVVFDYLHQMLHNPARLPVEVALGLALATWPRDVRPKIHFSSPRTEAHLGPQGGAAVLPPRPGQHADFVNPFEFAALLRHTRSCSPFDIMLEAKAGDLALLRLREDLARYAPDVAALVH